MMKWMIMVFWEMKNYQKLCFPASQESPEWSFLAVNWFYSWYL